MKIDSPPRPVRFKSGDGRDWAMGGICSGAFYFLLHVAFPQTPTRLLVAAFVIGTIAFAFAFAIWRSRRG